MVGWVLLLVFGCFALFLSAWWSIAFIIVLGWQINQWFIYKSKPWRRVHFPLMRAYSAAAGLESAKAEKEGREFNVDNAIYDLVKATYSEWDQVHTEEFIHQQFSLFSNFSDELLIREQILLKNPNASQESMDKLIKLTRDSFQTLDNSKKVRAVIAGIIEKQHGQEQRVQYLLNSLQGKAW